VRKIPVETFSTAPALMSQPSSLLNASLILDEPPVTLASVDRGSYTAPVPDFSHPVAPEYKLYEIEYRLMSVEDWHSVPPDRTQYSYLWASPDRFRAISYLPNMKAKKCCPSPLGIVYFLIVLAVPVYLAVHVTRNASQIVTDVKPYEKLWLAALSIPPVLALLELFAAEGIPMVFMLWGMWGASLFAIAGAVYCVLVKVYVGVGVIVFLELFALLFFIWMPPGAVFASEVLRFSRRIVFSLPVFFVFFVCFVLAGAVLALHGYIACHAADYKEKWWVYVVIVYTDWVLTLVVGQVLYQFVGQVVAARIFLGPRGSEPREWSHVVMFGRALFTNIGIATFNATVLPFIRFFFALATVEPCEVAERLKFWRCAEGCITAIYRPFHMCGLALAQCIDRALVYPNERAAIYASMFGIPRKPASRRVAETEANYFTSVMNVNCYIDYLVAFIGFFLAVACAFAGWAYGRKNGDLKHAWIGCALGGFSVFGFFNTVRMLLLGISDAIFICFFENPEALALVSRDLEEIIKSEYEHGVERKRNVALVRQRGGTYSITSTPLLT
jgi:hypothetical protein